MLLSSREIYGMSGMTLLPVTESRPEVQAGIGEHGGADFLMIRDFVASINSGSPITVDIRAALRMTLPGLFALQSAERGGELVSILLGVWDAFQWTGVDIDTGIGFGSMRAKPGSVPIQSSTQRRDPERLKGSRVARQRC